MYACWANGAVLEKQNSKIAAEKGDLDNRCLVKLHIGYPIGFQY